MAKALALVIGDQKEVDQMGRPKSNLPATRQASLPADPFESLSSIAKLEANTSRSLDRLRDFLEPRIDTKRFTDDDWLADPKNARTAAFQLKFLNMQKETALGVISTQARLDTNKFDRAGREARSNAALERIEAALNEREASSSRGGTRDTPQR